MLSNKNLVRKSWIFTLILKVLVLTACGQENLDSQITIKPDNNETQNIDSEPNLDNAFSGELNQGDWFQKENDDSTILMFGLPRSEAQLLLRCNLVSKEIIVDLSNYIPDKQQIQVKIITPTGESTYQGTVYDETLPSISFPINTNDPFLQKLATTKDRFAVVPQLGEPMLVPATPKLQDLIEDCQE